MVQSSTQIARKSPRIIIPWQPGDLYHLIFHESFPVRYMNVQVLLYFVKCNSIFNMTHSIKTKHSLLAKETKQMYTYY
jgi:hypothetical protein